jgi:hypothetical protein
MAPKVRKLPVLQTVSPEDERAARRPAWQWIALGAVFVLSLWMPLAVLGLWIGRWIAAAWIIENPSDMARFSSAATGAERVALVIAVLVPILGSFAAACAAGGALVGRFGGSVRASHTAIVGLLSAALAWGLAGLGGALSPWPVALLSLLLFSGTGVLFSWMAGKWGLLRRRAMARVTE